MPPRGYDGEDWKALAPQPLPHSGPEFEAMMREVDAALVAAGQPIPNRPIHAIREISLRYQVPVPMPADPARLPTWLHPFAPLSAAINDWYERVYGDRLKVDMTPGRTAAILDGDLSLLVVPRLYGTVHFELSRTFRPRPTTARGPAICNIVQLVKGLTPAKAALLSDGSLQCLGEAFGRALPALYTLENTEHELVRAARGDVATAVSCLMAPVSGFGPSKWASLQAAEKILKAALALASAPYSRTHNLADLGLAVREAGIPFDKPALLNAIQCSAGIRYGEEACDLSQALAAHHASLEVVNGLRDAGAKFQTGPG
jgi:hypothetical protein